MNDYLKRETENAAKLRAEVAPIAVLLEWELLPDNPKHEHMARAVYMRNADGLEISATESWNKPDKLEFNASKWPRHTDREGAPQHTSPSDTYQPREHMPTTTATRTRAPEAIAKQIKNKLITDYVRIYARLQGIADKRQAYADKEAKLIAGLLMATQETGGHHRHRRLMPHSVRNIKGAPLYITYRSPSSVTIDLGAEEMISVIAFLRTRREAVS